MMALQRLIDRIRPRKRRLVTLPSYIATCGWCDVILSEPAASQGAYTYRGHRGGLIHLCDDCAAFLGFCKTCKSASCQHTKAAR